MPKASNLKSGMIVRVREQPHIVKKMQANNPSARGAATLYKVRFNHVSTGQKLDESFKGEDFLPEVDFQRRAVQFSYKDGDAYVFMDNEDYSQYQLDGDQLEEVTSFLGDGLTGITALLVEDACGERGQTRGKGERGQTRIALPSRPATAPATTLLTDRVGDKSRSRVTVQHSCA